MLEIPSSRGTRPLKGEAFHTRKGGGFGADGSGGEGGLLAIESLHLKKCFQIEEGEIAKGGKGKPADKTKELSDVESLEFKGEDRNKKSRARGGRTCLTSGRIQLQTLATQGKFVDKRGRTGTKQKGRGLAQKDKAMLKKHYLFGKKISSKKEKSIWLSKLERILLQARQGVVRTSFAIGKPRETVSPAGGVGPVKRGKGGGSYGIGVNRGQFGEFLRRSRARHRVGRKQKRPP